MITYKEAGVDVEKEEKAIKSLIKDIRKQRIESGKPITRYAGEIYVGENYEYCNKPFGDVCMCEPLRGKIEEFQDHYIHFKADDIKSAVKGLIKYHEDKIEHMIKHLQESEIKLQYPKNKMLEISALKALKNEYNVINAIELWLEDAI